MAVTVLLHDDKYDDDYRGLFEELQIKTRVCYKFCPKGDHENICVCNQERSAHKSVDKHNTRSKWHISTHTTEAHAYNGKLTNGAYFAQLDIQTNFKKIEQLLIKVWKLPNPTLIMSIYGGAQRFKLTNDLQSTVINGIINVAIKSNVWLITNGYDNGIVHLVGKEIKKMRSRQIKENITAIAVCKWGCIKDIECLILRKNEEKNRTKALNFHYPETEYTDDKLRHGESQLEKNHTHYLMVDDGKYRDFDMGDFRQHLCSYFACRDNGDARMASVSVVMEGGFETLKAIYHDLKRFIPVVIIKGSGRIADLLIDWLSREVGSTDDEGEVYDIEEYQRDPGDIPSADSNSSGPLRSNRYVGNASRTKLVDDSASFSNDLERDLKCLLEDEKNPKENGSSSSSTDAKFQHAKVKEALGYVKFCLQRSVRPWITIYKSESSAKLSETIFTTISKTFSKKRHHKDSFQERELLLQLAMDWNCVQVAKEFVFEHSLHNITKETANECFIRALTEDLPAFVYEFLRLGIKPAEAFSAKETNEIPSSQYKIFLKKLYNNKILEKWQTEILHFHKISESNKIQGIEDVSTLNEILKDIIGDYMYNLYFDSEEDENKNRILYGLKESAKISDNESHQSSSIETSQDRRHKRIMRDLFIWAVLMNHIDMAKVILCYLKYRICPALIATKILKTYCSITKNDHLKADYLKDANYFEQYAIDCLDHCDDFDAEQTCKLVIQQNELYGYVTCLQVAANADDKRFLSTPCCEQAIKNIWYDKLDPDQSTATALNRIGLLLGIISLGILAPVFCNYRVMPKEDADGTTMKQKFKENTIRYFDPYPFEYPEFIRRRVKEGSPFDRYIRQWIQFHLCSQVKFVYHFIIYIFFLLLFSYVLLFNFSPPVNGSASIHGTEIAVIILVTFMFIEELRFFFTQENITFWGKLKHYFKDSFKVLTVMALILFYIGLILRFTNAKTPNDFIAARVIMAFDIELWWLRCLSFIIVIPNLGPQLVAIGKMFEDLMLFIYIIAVVMIGYGVASRSMFYYPEANGFTQDPDSPIDVSFDGRAVFRQVLYPVYYFMYGKFSQEMANFDKRKDYAASITSHVLLAAHMMFVNILLFNMLIAMFSKRFDEVNEDTQNIWHSQQYTYTNEYFMRSPFMPLISFFHDAWSLIRDLVYAIRRDMIHKPYNSSRRMFKIIPRNDDIVNKWREFEGAATYKFAHSEVEELRSLSATLSYKLDPSDAETQDDMDKYNQLKDIADSIEKLKQKTPKIVSTHDTKT